MPPLITDQRRWWLAHLTVPTAIFVLLFVFLEWSDFDRASLRPFFDDELHTFPLRRSALFDDLFHQGGKFAVLGATVALALVALASFRFRRLVAWRVPGFYLVLCVATTTTIVGVLKAVTHRYPPWSLDIYGGKVPDTPLLVPPPGFDGGGGWPAGHAAAGFAWLALYFVGRHLGAPRGRWWLVPPVLLGILFAWTQHVRGAHFPSHNVATVTIAWLVAVGLAWAFTGLGWWNPASTRLAASDPQPQLGGIAAAAWIAGGIGMLLGASLFAFDTAIDLLRHSPKALHRWIEGAEFSIVGPGLGCACLLACHHLLSLRSAAARAQRAEHERRLLMLGNIAAAVAHEVRNPLHNLRLVIDELRVDLPELRRHELDARIDTSLERIDRAVELVYHLARPGAEGDAAGDLAAVARETADALRATGAVIQAEVPDRADVRFGTAALRIVIGNLLRNSVEAAGGGAVRMVLCAEGPTWHLRITNPGSLPAHSAAATTPGKPGGLGIGLTISRQLVANAAGTLDLDQADGQVRTDLALPAWTG